MRLARILCPVDFSTGSRLALRYASIVAERHRAQLTVLFVNDPLLSAAAAAAAYDVKRLAASTEAALARFVARALGTRATAVETTVAHGEPPKEIERVARSGRHDLIVLGSRGLTRAPKWFFGSTTERTLRATKVPVLVVSPRGRRLSGGWLQALQAWPGRHALLPIDLEDYTLGDVRASVAAARALGAEARLLHAVRRSPVPEWLRVNPARHDAKRVESARRRLRALAKSVGAADAQVVFGDPAEQIALCAAANDVELTAFTLRRAAMFGPRQGSITYKVIARGAGPVLALPSTRRR
jgi:nucleotide-binding universal stress UspA family protein